MINFINNINGSKLSIVESEKEITVDVNFFLYRDILIKYNGLSIIVVRLDKIHINYESGIINVIHMTDHPETKNCICIRLEKDADVELLFVKNNFVLNIKE